jgi:Flp pilus assembly protein TadD
MADAFDHVLGLCGRKRFADAHEYVSELLRERPDDPLLRLLNALVYAREGQVSCARDLAEQVAVTDASCEAVASMIWAALGDIGRAVSFGRRATADDPNDWRGFAALALAYTAEAEADHQLEAERAARKAVELAPEEARAHAALGQVLLAYTPGPRVHKEGVAALKRAAELSSDDEEIQALVAQHPRSFWKEGCLALLGLMLIVAWNQWIFEFLGDSVARSLPFGHEPDSVRMVGARAVGFLIVAVAGAAVAGIFWAINVTRKGDRVSTVILQKRAASRNLYLTDQAGLRLAALGAALAVCVVPSGVTGFLAASAAEGDPWSPGMEAGPLAAAAILTVAGSAGTRWWLGPGRLRQILGVSALLRAYLLVSYGIVIMTIALSAARVTDTALWTAVVTIHIAWFLAAFGPIVIAHRTNRRREAP